MSEHLTPKEARERLDRGEVLEAGIGRLYRAHGNRIEFCDPHGWEESRRHGGIRELAEMVPMRVPAPTLADDLWALIQMLRDDTSLGEVADDLEAILRKHGEESRDGAR